MALARSELWRKRLDIPAYRVGEAARYVRMSPSAVSRWQKERGGASGPAGSRKPHEGLSYLHLIEVAVVAALRNAGFKLWKINDSRRFLCKKFGYAYPFAQARFKSDGAEVLLDPELLGAEPDKAKLVSATAGGQLVWADLLRQRLREFNYGDDGLVHSWHVGGEGSPVWIDPRIAFGAPQVRGTPTWALKGRWMSGESVADIADDFSLRRQDVISALEFEGLEVDLRRPNQWAN